MRETRIPLVTALVLAALLSMVNVSAYKQGNVTQSMIMTIDTSSQAALSIISSSPLASEASGMMQVDFSGQTMQYPHTEGSGTTVSVLGDSFQMYDIFRVQNRSSDCLNLSVYVVNAGTTPVPNLSQISGRLTSVAPPGTALASTGGVQTAGVVNLGPSGGGKDAMSVDFNWSVTGTATAGGFQLRVNSTKTLTCP